MPQVNIDNPKFFSIIIPLYNKELYILNTIKSVLQQDYKFFELIIVDDGSTDNSIDVVLEVSDERVRLLRKNNGGVSSARNYGIDNAKYDLIAFLDADDYWNENYLSSMINLIEEFPDAKMYGSSYGEVVNGVLIPSRIYSLIDKDFRGYFDYFDVFQKMYISPICSSAVVIKREIFNETLRFYNGINSGEDLLLWIQIADKYKVVYLNKILSYYNRDVVGSITSRLCKWDSYFLKVLDDCFKDRTGNLRRTIDGLIVRYFRPYYAFSLCAKSDEIKLLQSVDFSNQDYKHRLFYMVIPKFVIKLLYNCAYLIRGK